MVIDSEETMKDNEKHVKSNHSRCNKSTTIDLILDSPPF